ncbi:MAG: hypothetical protein BGO01_20110 [Armatimonadetes bacterium 55-13]|nr:hypothetical protein [Armatimonadota bacterium]OJU64417.1 MAG: hypothetical protein BGO01_20110 [Armatimonadetes bacterium 55-13]
MLITFIASAVFYSSANEYVTLFRDTDGGSTKLQVIHDELNLDNRKATLINVNDKKAWIINDSSSGNITLIIGEEAYTSPAPKEDEPVASVSYFAKVYANAAGPKPKKKGILGGLGGNLLGGLTGVLTNSLFSAAFSNSLGAMSSQALASQAIYTVQGIAVQEMKQSLGRATSYTSVTKDEDPVVMKEITKVDKTTMVETLRLRKVDVPDSDIPNPSSPKSVTAKELYEAFSKFLIEGIDEEKK